MKTGADIDRRAWPCYGLRNQAAEVNSAETGCGVDSQGEFPRFPAFAAPDRAEHARIACPGRSEDAQHFIAVQATGLAGFRTRSTPTNVVLSLSRPEKVHYVNGIPKAYSKGPPPSCGKGATAKLLRLSRSSRCVRPCPGTFWKRCISSPTTQVATT
jgi:hypothetical protein